MRKNEITTAFGEAYVFELKWHFQILFHGDSLNGMVELSADPFSVANIGQEPSSPVSLAIQSHQCRFCGNCLETPQQVCFCIIVNRSIHIQVLNSVCGHEDCINFYKVACEKILQCRHYCGGIKGEETCLPCLTCHADCM